jgi:tRNA(Ile)-lysidine synthase
MNHEQINWTLLHAKVHQTLKKRQLLPKNSRILMAVSGGQDSLCLSKLLLDLQAKWNWHLAIAHCDHRWHSDAGMAEWVRKIAINWQIDSYLQEAESSLPETEAAARTWRYQSLVEIAQQENFTYIVTGHTKSDQAETLLYNLIRGAGADGLSSLTWQRWLTPAIQLIRPILDLTRQETLAFCQQFELPIWFDSVNHNLKYARNRIRQELIPNLQANFNPQVENSLAQTAELLKADVEYLNILARELLKQVRSSDCQKLNRYLLRQQPLSLQRRTIRQFLEEIIHKNPNFEQIETVRALITAPNKTRTSTLSRQIVAEVSGKWIIFNKISIIKASNNTRSNQKNFE